MDIMLIHEVRQALGAAIRKRDAEAAGRRGLKERRVMGRIQNEAVL